MSHRSQIKIYVFYHYWLWDFYVLYFDFAWYRWLATTYIAELSGPSTGLLEHYCDCQQSTIGRRTKCIFVIFSSVVVVDDAVNAVLQALVHLHGNEVRHSHEQVDKETLLAETEQVSMASSSWLHWTGLATGVHRELTASFHFITSIHCHTTKYKEQFLLTSIKIYYTSCSTTADIISVPLYEHCSVYFGELRSAG